MRAALREAQRAFDEGEVPIGAVIAREGKIIARGRNAIEKKQQAPRHAEIIAIERASRKLRNWRLTGCTLYITIEPCPMCAAAACLSRVDRIVYGSPDVLFGSCGTVYRLPQEGRLKHSPTVDGGIAEQECRALLQRFFKTLRGKP
jgi:tRNA(adenine34) deaminase